MEKDTEKKPFLAKYKWTWKSFFFSFAWLAVLLLVFDVASKWAVELNCPYGERVTVIPNFFYITLSHNYGAAFSAGAGVLWARILFIIISWAMSIAILIYWRKEINKEDHLSNAILMVILAGALGNAIDRTFYWGSAFSTGDVNSGMPYGVIDFLQFYLGGGPEGASSVVNPFATFNIADSCVVVGVIMLIIVMIVRSIKTKGEDEEDPRIAEAKKDDSNGKED